MIDVMVEGVIEDIEMWTGSRKVIVKSNEDEPFEVGELVEVKAFGTTKIPTVRINENRLLQHHGVMIPYSIEIENMLLKLSNKRQWEILSGISVMMKVMNWNRM